jgi:hypothetical protein
VFSPPITSVTIPVRLAGLFCERSILRRPHLRLERSGKLLRIGSQEPVNSFVEGLLAGVTRDLFFIRSRPLPRLLLTPLRGTYGTHHDAFYFAILDAGDRIGRLVVDVL